MARIFNSQMAAYNHGYMCGRFGFPGADPRQPREEVFEINLDFWYGARPKHAAMFTAGYRYGETEAREKP